MSTSVLTAPEYLRSEVQVMEEFGRCDPCCYHELWGDRVRFTQRGKIRLAATIGTLLGLGASIEFTDAAHDAATELHKKLHYLANYGGQCDGVPANKIEIDATTKDPFTFGIAWFRVYAGQWLKDEVQRLMDYNDKTFVFQSAQTRDKLEEAVMHGQGIDQTLTETRYVDDKLTRYFYRQCTVGGMIPTYSAKPGWEGIITGWSIHT